MELDLQTIIAFGILLAVVAYLANKFVVKPFRNSKAGQDHHCGPDCKCM